MPANKETRYKFVVSSAEEAVKVLRERLGENAKVISVRQVEGAGLARFLRAPKLEVIAEVAPVPSVPVVEPSGSLENPIDVPQVVEREGPPSGNSLSRILHRGGLSDVMIGRLRSKEEWAGIAKLPWRRALMEVAMLLRADYRGRAKKPTGECMAFIGTPGSGKTTALCKRLTMEVFFKQRRATVLKVDMDKGNPGDGLAVFCEVLGVPMIRSLDAVASLPPDDTLYIDFPGIAPENQREIEEVSRLLTDLSVVSRVLVVNAAYEVSLIKRAYGMASAVDATHVVFTHLDELTQWGKLWEFILAPGLTPLFLSSGQNIAGDFNEAVFDGVLERSFPMIGKENAVQADAV